MKTVLVCVRSVYLAAFLLIIAAAPEANAGAAEPAKPRDFFAQYAAKLADAVPFKGIQSDFPDIQKQQETVFGPEAESPARFVDLENWSVDYKRVESRFPVVFNPARKSLELSRETLEQSSPAMQEFVYFFCKAYSRLNPELAASGSPLAFGLAARIAADRLYPTAHAILPIPLIDYSVIAQALLMEQPALWRSAFGLGKEYQQHVSAAVVSMTRVKGAAEGAGRLAHTVHEDLSWLITEPVGSSRAKLSDFFSIHPGAAQEMVQRARHVRHLTIRARLTQVCLVPWVGSPNINKEAVAQWETEFNGLMGDYAAELKLRNDVKFGAPTFTAEHPENVTVSSPEFFAVILAFSTELDAATSQPGWTEAEMEALDAEGLKTLLAKAKHSGRVLEMSGATPRLELQRENATSIQNTNITAVIYFESLMRPYPADWKGDPAKLDAQGKERVWAVWWKPEPVGEGKPFVAVHPQTFLTVAESGQYRRVEASQVKLGDKVIGFVPVVDPSKTNTAPFRSLKPVEFTVVKITPHRVRQHLAIRLNSVDKKSSSTLSITPMTHMLTVIGATDLHWKFANQVQPDEKTWAMQIAADVWTVQQREYERGQAMDFLEFTLVSKKRKEANNFMVALSASGPDLAIVEASPVNASSIHPDEMVQQADDGLVAARNLRAHPHHKDGINDKGLAGYYVKPPEDRWPNPLLTRHTTWAVTNKFVPQPMAYKLVFSDDSTLTLGELSWVLTLNGSQLEEACVHPITLKIGSKIVTGVDGEKPTTIELKSLQTITFPRDARPDYVVLELANVQCVKAGPALVLCEERPLDEEVPGLVMGSPLALLVGVSSGTHSPGSSAPPQVSRIASETIPVGTNAHGSVVASWDPATSRTNFVVARVGVQTEGRSSRTIAIEVVHPVTQQRMRVWIGSAQWLAVSLPRETVWKQPGQLVPKDRAIIALPGDILPREVTIQRVTPYFGLPDTQMFLLKRQIVNLYADGLTPHGKIVFNEGFAMALKDRGVTDGEDLGQPLEGGGLGRGGSGPSSGSVQNGQISSLRKDSPVFTDLPELGVEDRIHIPPDVMSAFKTTGVEVWAKFLSEAETLRPIPAAHARFWNEQIKEPLARLLANSRALNKSAEGVAQIDEALEAAQIKMPYEQAAAQPMIEWVKMMHGARERFLESPTTRRLAEVAFLETVTAAWLNEMGAAETARILQRDLVYLALVTACERDKAVVRIPNLNLMLLIELPTFISGEDPAKLQQFRVGGGVQRIVKEWAARNDTVNVVVGGEVKLSDVKTAFAKVTGMAESPYIVGIPRIGGDGQLTQTRGVRPEDVADHEQNGITFKKWLTDRATLAALKPQNTVGDTK